jgi:hypothetical protein
MPMPLPTMRGNYYDPDTNPRMQGAYDPCAQGVFLTFDPEAGAPPVAAIVTSIGAVNEVQFALKVSSIDGLNQNAILTKEQVSKPAIDNFSYLVHNNTDIFEGTVTVRAEIVNEVKHVYIEP